MRILVTGVSGFSGAFVARHLAQAGHRVIGNYRRPSRFLETLSGLPGLELVPGDLADAAQLPGPFEGVVHVAATSIAPGISVARMAVDNVVGTRALIEAALGWRVQGFVYFSTLSIYGTVERAVVDEDTPVLNPDPYGMTKLLGEQMLAEEATRVPGLALRLPGILGPGAHRNWLSGVASKLRRDETLPIYNPDGAFNNAVHVADLAALVQGSLERGWDGFDTLVLGAAGATTVASAIRRLARALGAEARFAIQPEQKPTFTLSSERAIQRYGYRPMSITELLDRYAAEVLAWESAKSA